MLCPKCGYYSESEETVCPACGEILKHDSGFRSQGAQAIRQGKKAREAAKNRPASKKEDPEKNRRRRGASHATIEMPAVRDTRTSEETQFDNYTVPDTGRGQQRPSETFERRRRSVYDEEADAETAACYLAARDSGRNSRRGMVNWVKIFIITFVTLVVVLVGTRLVLDKTFWGNQNKARMWTLLNDTSIGKIVIRLMGDDISSSALWAVGDEKMNAGDVYGAIACFERAQAQDQKEGVVDVDGLLMLGNAYEAAGELDKASALYETIYTETPSRTEAYINHIRILQNSDDEKDLVKAGELMKTAYEKTGDTTFQTQRSDLLPAPPETSLIAAFYETKKTFSLTSYQGFDVYYTFDADVELPYGGTKFTKPITLDEGTYYLRAVAVNGELVSDELRATYKIIMPSPQAPQCNLAPNTYKTSQKVKLRPGKDNENDDDIVIYYTVDGSNPDSDSPIYHTGDQIQLANGWVTLKAVAVNKYRKVSNMLEVKYKIEANPKPKTAFSSEDAIGKLKINQTTQMEFQEMYGEGTPAGAVEMENFTTECRRFDYPWGYAVMNLSKKTWVLVEVSFHTTGTLAGPRKTQVGDQEKYVVDQYKDMLQVESKSGNRGLYSTDKGTGKIWVQEDDTKIIRYRYPVDTHWVQLEYHIGTNGLVDNIDLKYIP